MKTPQPSLQKYQKIFSEMSCIDEKSSISANHHVPSSLLSRTSLIKCKKIAPLASTSLQKLDLSATQGLIDPLLKEKSVQAKETLAGDLRKKREKIKSINDISFLKDTKENTRISLRENSVIKEGIEVFIDFYRFFQNFIKKNFTDRPCEQSLNELLREK